MNHSFSVKFAYPDAAHCITETCIPHFVRTKLKFNMKKKKKKLECTKKKTNNSDAVVTKKNKKQKQKNADSTKKSFFVLLFSSFMHFLFVAAESPQINMECMFKTVSAALGLQNNPLQIWRDGCFPKDVWEANFFFWRHQC